MVELEFCAAVEPRAAAVRARRRNVRGIIILSRLVPLPIYLSRHLW